MAFREDFLMERRLKSLVCFSFFALPLFSLLSSILALILVFDLDWRVC